MEEGGVTAGARRPPSMRSSAPRVVLGHRRPAPGAVDPGVDLAVVVPPPRRASAHRPPHTVPLHTALVVEAATAAEHVVTAVTDHVAAAAAEEYVVAATAADHIVAAGAREHLVAVNVTGGYAIGELVRSEHTGQYGRRCGCADHRMSGHGTLLLRCYGTPRSSSVEVRDFENVRLCTCRVNGWHSLHGDSARAIL